MFVVWIVLLQVRGVALDLAEALHPEVDIRVRGQQNARRYLIFSAGSRQHIFGPLLGDDIDRLLRKIGSRDGGFGRLSHGDEMGGGKEADGPRGDEMEIETVSLRGGFEDKWIRNDREDPLLSML